MVDVKMDYTFPSEQASKFKELEKKFPKKSSLVIWGLHLVQEDKGYIPPEAIRYIAQKAEVSPAWVSGVISFYEAFREKPIGKYHLQVCYNATCWMMGSDEIEKCIQKKLKLKSGETTSDKQFTYTHTQECLAGCDKAPVMLINHDYHENLDPKKVTELIDELKEK